MDKKIKIGVFIRGFHNGGIEKVFENYFSHMDLSPYEIHMITHMKNIPEKKKIFEDYGCIIHELSAMKGHKIKKKNIDEYKKLFRENRFDIVHNNMPDFLLPLWFAKRNHVPVRILHSHSNYMELVKLKSKALVKIYERGFSLNAGMATVLIALNETTAKSVFMKKSGSAKILSNAIDVDQFRFDPDTRRSIRKSLGVGDDTVLLGHVGRYENDMKNQQLLIEIFENLCKNSDRHHLLMIGDGKHRASIMEAAAEKGIADRITFTGNVYNVRDYYMAMDIFLLPSKQEGLGIVAIEAEASGLPCIVSDHVPKDVDITEPLSFLPIYGDGVIDTWTRTILEYSNHLRTDGRGSNAEKVSAAGYDISKQAINLSNIYLSRG